MILVPHLPYKNARGIVEPAIDVVAINRLGDGVCFVENDPSGGQLTIDAYRKKLAPFVEHGGFPKILCVGNPLKTALVIHEFLVSWLEVEVGVYNRHTKSYDFTIVKEF